MALWEERPWTIPEQRLKSFHAKNGLIPPVTTFPTSPMEGRFAACAVFAVLRHCSSRSFMAGRDSNNLVLPHQTLAASVRLSHVLVRSLCFSAVGGHRSLGSILCPVCTNVNDSTKGEPKPVGSSRIFELLSNQWVQKSELKPVGNYSKEERKPEYAGLPTLCRAPMGNPLQDRHGAIL